MECSSLSCSMHEEMNLKQIQEKIKALLHITPNLGEMFETLVSSRKCGAYGIYISFKNGVHMVKVGGINYKLFRFIAPNGGLYWNVVSSEKSVATRIRGDLSQIRSYDSVNGFDVGNRHFELFDPVGVFNTTYDVTSHGVDVHEVREEDRSYWQVSWAVDWGQDHKNFTKMTDMYEFVVQLQEFYILPDEAVNGLPEVLK